MRNAEDIGYCKWQLYEKAVEDRGDYFKITYSCRYKQCDAQLIYHEKKVDKNAKDDDPYPKKYYLAKSKIHNRHNHLLKLTRKLSS